MSAPQLKPKRERKDGKKRQRASTTGGTASPRGTAGNGNAFTIPKRKKEPKRIKVPNEAVDPGVKSLREKRPEKEEKHAIRDVASSRNSGDGGGISARLAKAPPTSLAPRIGLGLTDMPMDMPTTHDPAFTSSGGAGGVRHERTPSKSMMSLAVAAASVAANEAAMEAAEKAKASATTAAPAPTPAPPKALGLKKMLHQRVQSDEASANPMSAFSPKKLLKHRLLTAQADQDAASSVLAMKPKTEMAENNHTSANRPGGHGSMNRYRNDDVRSSREDETVRANSRDRYPAHADHDAGAVGEANRLGNRDAHFNARDKEYVRGQPQGDERFDRSGSEAGNSTWTEAGKASNENGKVESSPRGAADIASNGRLIRDDGDRSSTRPEMGDSEEGSRTGREDSQYRAATDGSLRQANGRSDYVGGRYASKGLRRGSSKGRGTYEDLGKHDRRQGMHWDREREDAEGHDSYPPPREQQRARGEQVRGRL